MASSLTVSDLPSGNPTPAGVAVKTGVGKRKPVVYVVRESNRPNQALLDLAAEGLYRLAQEHRTPKTLVCGISGRES